VARTGEHADAADARAATIRLRLLATSDLHMKLTGYDYFHGRPGTAPGGLGHLAATIARLRTGTGCSLLFDNGDLLQGNPLADHLAAQDCGPHPAIAWLNALAFDAATLGNHDFNYGPRVLARVLRGANHPVVLANAHLPGNLRLPRWVLLRRPAVDTDGTLHELRVGVIGLLPPQTAAWEAQSMPGLRVDDMLATARAEVPRMRAAGADLVVALAHSGLSPEPETEGMENAAAALAAVPGIDAVVAGHTHLPFPAPGDSGLVAGTPVVLPGFGGAHLGVIDLTLQRQGRAPWQVVEAASRLHPAEAAPVPERLMRSLLPAHRGALRAQSRRAGGTRAPLQSHLTLIGHDAGLALVAAAQRWHLRNALRSTPWAGLPILAAAAPSRSGGRGGPAHYTDVPAGRLARRHLADLYAFPNRIAALIVTGAELRDWLERAASAFALLTPGAQDQPLLDPAFPGYQFDVIFGLRWSIDLACPARYDSEGRVVGPPEGRVRDLSYHGRPVTADDRFVLGTNSYRLSGVGLYAPFAREPLLDGPERVRDVLHAYLRRRRVVAPEARLPFRFAPLPGTTAWLDTSPAVCLNDAPLDARPLRLTDKGFMRLRVKL